MQFYPIYRQNDASEVESLIRSQVTCNLLTVSPKGSIHLGIFNHYYAKGKFVLHLNKTDEQIADMKATPRATLSLLEMLALIPSYWVDEEYGGAATMYYRYAEFACDVKIEEDTSKMTDLLQSLMDRYQPEGGYTPLDANDPIYKASFGMLSLVTLTPTATRTKWKLGQNRPEEIRRQVVTELRRRGTAGDLRAADEVERWLAAHAR